MLWPILFPLIDFSHHIIEFPPSIRLSGFNHGRKNAFDKSTIVLRCAGDMIQPFNSDLLEQMFILCQSCVCLYHSSKTIYLSIYLSISIICNLQRCDLRVLFTVLFTFCTKPMNTFSFCRFFSSRKKNYAIHNVIRMIVVYSLVQND